MATASLAPSSLMLSTENVDSSKREMFGNDSDFLRGGFRGVLNVDLENRGIAVST